MRREVYYDMQDEKRWPAAQTFATLLENLCQNVKLRRFFEEKP